MPEQMSEGWESLRELLQIPNDDVLLERLGGIYAQGMAKQRKKHSYREPGDPSEVEFLAARARGFTEAERQRWAHSRFCALLLKLHWRSEPPSPETLLRWKEGALTGFEAAAMKEHLEESIGPARNVLMMLATTEPPPPREEVAWHVAHCATHGYTHIITCRKEDLNDHLTTDQSVVAFYGDKRHLANAYLGKGIFLEYIPKTEPEYQQILKASELYSPPGRPVGSRTPANAWAFIKMRDVRVAAPGERLESLNGIIEASGRPLTLANLPSGLARIAVFYCPKSSKAAAPDDDQGASLQ
jgi:hypothetical protein